MTLVDIVKTYKSRIVKTGTGILTGLYLLACSNLGYIFAAERQRIAVMNLKGQGVSSMDAAVISEFLREELFKIEKYEVLERDNMEQIIKEQAFQQSGCTSTECAIELGKILNVKNMVVGSVSKLEDQYFINMRLVNIETGEVFRAENEEGHSLLDLKENLVFLTQKLIGDYDPRAREIIKKTKKENFGLEGIINEGGVVYIPAGESIIGGSNKDFRRVFVDSFYIDKCEVTNKQFKKFVDTTGYVTDLEKQGGGYLIDRKIKGVSWRNPEGHLVRKSRWDSWKPVDSYKPDHPVIYVSWNDAVAYAKWVGKRLPTSIEWEKACRAGTITTYYFGDNSKELGDYAWYEDNASDPSMVGLKKPNSYGLYDMYGNVSEWCLDKWKPSSSNYKGEGHVLRGGSYADSHLRCRSGVDYIGCFEFINALNKKCECSIRSIGFRCAKDAK